MQLIKNDSVCIEAVLVRHIRRKHLIGTVCRNVGDLLLRFQYLAPLFQCRTEPYHIDRYIKYDFCLVTVGSTAVDFRSLLSVTTEEKQGNRSRQFRLSIFLWNLDVGGVELTVAVLLYRTEYITNDLLLPIHQFKRLTRPCSFCMAEALYEFHGKVSEFLIIVGILQLKPCRLIFFEFLHMVTSKNVSRKGPP